MTPWTTAHQASLSLTISEFAQVYVHCISDAIQPSSSHTLFSFCPQSFPVSRTFPVSQLMIKYQRTKSSDDKNTGVSASASVLPNIYYSRLISLKIDWFDLFALQGTLRSVLQHHSLKASVLWCFAFFADQLSQPYVTSGRTIWTFVSRAKPLLFNTLSRFIITFLPRSNYFLISWLQSLFTVILEPKKRKFVTASTFSPSICHEVMGLEVMDLHFF